MCYARAPGPDQIISVALVEGLEHAMVMWPHLICIPSRLRLAVRCVPDTRQMRLVMKQQPETLTVCFWMFFHPSRLTAHAVLMKLCL